MGQENLHVFFFPFMAHGHMIPAIDMAITLAKHGLTVSIITTPINASFLQSTIQKATLCSHSINLHLLPFPTSEAGLPDGCENFDQITSQSNHINFWKAVSLLQNPLDRLVEKLRPNCIVSDMFLPWTADIARKYGIPRIIFNGSSFVYLCACDSATSLSPASDAEVFVLPGLPHRIEMTRLQLPDFLRGRSDFWDSMKKANSVSYGVVMNSFYELEPAYAEYYKKKETGKKVWHIGPLSLYNRNINDMAERGMKASIDEHECLRWLNSMKQHSVIYLCFGSVRRCVNRQLMEIASALKALGYPFIWVVKRHELSAGENGWLPEGFEEWMQGKGMIIRGWAPQVLILNHPSVGAFVTHCGWNSVLEGVSAGVPMVAWPAFAEQFFNEKLITQVLKIGVCVDDLEWVCWLEEGKQLVERERIEKAIRRVMGGGDDADGMRKRAKELGEMGQKAVEEGGSSYNDLSRFIQDLKTYGQQQQRDEDSHLLVGPSISCVQNSGGPT